MTAARPMPCGENKEEYNDKESTLSVQGDGTYLFTTKTCPNCKIAKTYLEDMKYQTIDAEENAELAYQFKIMQAPTLVVIQDGQVDRYVNASNIKRYVEDQTV